MNALQLLSTLRDIRNAAEEHLGSLCYLTIYIDRVNRDEGIILEIRHMLGQVKTDGLTFCLLLDETDDLLTSDKLKGEMIEWIKTQVSAYVARYNEVLANNE